MSSKALVAIVIVIVGSYILWLVFAFALSQLKTQDDTNVGVVRVVIPNQEDLAVQQPEVSIEEAAIWSMKNVPVTTSYTDLQKLKEGGIDVVTTEWGLSSDPQEVKEFMLQTGEIGLQVVVDGGFSPAAWGYDTNYDGGSQVPQWQGELVQNWIKQIKQYPNIYAYDINNEFGENLPVPQQDIVDDVSWREKYAITKEQLRIVHDDVRRVDDNKPLLLRLRQWDMDSDIFVLEDHFEKNLVDIVMLNLYTNWVYNGYNPDEDLMIQQKAQHYIDEIRKIDPNVEIWISVAAFEDEPYFRKPSQEHIVRDVNNVRKLTDIEGIAFFGLGYENADSWYIFRDGVDLWQQITRIILGE